MNEIKEKNFVSAVVYIHNSEKYIKKFIKELNHFLNENFTKYEIICVNDGSTDNSVDTIRETSLAIGRSITIVNMSYCQGLEKSMTAGVDFAIGDFVYEFDSPYISYQEELMRSVYDRCLKGYDVVSACPEKSGH